MFKKIKRILLNILGDIKLYHFPMFIIYDPTTFKIKGYHTRQAMNIITPGCIVLRGYDNYADGAFIPGAFSHSGIYVGDGRIIHAIAEGVQEIDIIDFLRCDRFCILKPSSDDNAAIACKKAISHIDVPYDFDFMDGDDAFYCHELTATCYSMYAIKKCKTVIMGITVEPRYTCDSFLDNGNFEKILEVIPS